MKILLLVSWTRRGRGEYIKYNVNYKGVSTHFGLGGAHGARQPGVYESDDEHIIMSSDVIYYVSLIR